MKINTFARTVMWVLIICFVLLLLLWAYRFFSPTQIDDVSPLISCEKELLDKSDVLFVIPKFENVSIGENKSWCEYILSLNKTLAMHGVYHSYNEFYTDRDEEYLQEGMDIFYECFGVYPTEFKAPQLAINGYNKKLIETKMNFIGYPNQFFHKAYHCDDTGQMANRFIGII